MADRDLRLIEGVQRTEAYEIEMDGVRIRAYEGESVATALIAAGHWVFRRTPRSNAPRGIYCGMGACFDCLVVVDGAVVRACMTPASRNLQVRTLTGHGEPPERRSVHRGDRGDR